MSNELRYLGLTEEMERVVRRMEARPSHERWTAHEYAEFEKVRGGLWDWLMKYSQPKTRSSQGEKEALTFAVRYIQVFERFKTAPAV